jgi:hypothetical protein
MIMNGSLTIIAAGDILTAGFIGKRQLIGFLADLKPVKICHCFSGCYFRGKNMAGQSKSRFKELYVGADYYCCWSYPVVIQQFFLNARSMTISSVVLFNHSLMVMHTCVHIDVEHCFSLLATSHDDPNKQGSTPSR